MPLYLAELKELFFPAYESDSNKALRVSSFSARILYVQWSSRSPRKQCLWSIVGYILHESVLQNIRSILAGRTRSYCRVGHREREARPRSVHKIKTQEENTDI